MKRITFSGDYEEGWREGQEALKEKLIEQRCIGHGEGQRDALADVNAGRVDDLIQPRLKPLLDRIKELEWELKEAQGNECCCL